MSIWNQFDGNDWLPDGVCKWFEERGEEQAQCQYPYDGEGWPHLCARHREMRREYKSGKAKQKAWASVYYPHAAPVKKRWPDRFPP